ncbi:hypothetical protein D3C84_954020 [compost metagenome]
MYPGQSSRQSHGRAKRSPVLISIDYEGMIDLFISGKESLQLAELVLLQSSHQCLVI